MASQEAQCQARQNVMNLETYFMATAFLARHRSNDPKTQVGACIVNTEMKIIGIGYNGLPIGLSDSDFDWYNKKYFMCHAEMNAINSRNTADVKGCYIFVSSFPCNECAKIIIESGIKTVVFFSDVKCFTPEIQAAKLMFTKADVKYFEFKPPCGGVELFFSNTPLS